MISVAEAKQIIQQNLPLRRTINRPLADTFGKIVAADILAHTPSPHFVNSSMDGFAVRWTDVDDASAENLVSLTIIGESQAGAPFLGSLTKSSAVRINTGAIVPDGCDTVIPIEDCEVSTDGMVVNLRAVPQKGQHVRLVADEYDAGAVLIRAGTVLSPARIALLAQIGIVEVRIFKPPTVAVISTGTELVAYNKTPNELAGQIRDSNSVMLQAAIQESGGELVMSKRIEDDPEKIRKGIEQAAAIADIIFTIGGASVGPHDLIKSASQTIGFDQLFWRIRQKPGKPFYCAKKHESGQLLFGLPGNPVSVLMCYLQYVHPVLQYLSGRTFEWNVVYGRLSHELVNTQKRAEFLRVKLQTAEGDALSTIVPLAKQESYMLTSVTEADGFIFVEVDAEIHEGTVVPVFLF